MISYDMEDNSGGKYCRGQKEEQEHYSKREVNETELERRGRELGELIGEISGDNVGGDYEASDHLE